MSGALDEDLPSISVTSVTLLSSEESWPAAIRVTFAAHGDHRQRVLTLEEEPQPLERTLKSYADDVASTIRIASREMVDLGQWRS